MVSIVKSGTDKIKIQDKFQVIKEFKLECNIKSKDKQNNDEETLNRNQSGENYQQQIGKRQIINQ